VIRWIDKTDSIGIRFSNPAGIAR